VGELLKIVQAHLDATGVSEAEFSRRIGAAPQTVNAWRKRGIRALPTVTLLREVATVTGAGYGEVLRAALVDAGYDPPRPGRAKPGAWDLGLDTMVDLSVAADLAEAEASAIPYADEDSEPEDISAAFEDLRSAIEELAVTAHDVAEAGAGGRTHFTLAKAKRARRQKPFHQEQLAGFATDLRSAARTASGKSTGQQVRDSFPTGEESHDDDPRRTEHP